MEATIATGDADGAVPAASFRDDSMVQMLRQRLDECRAEADGLRAELDAAQAAAKRYEKALAALTDAPPAKPGRKEPRRARITQTATGGVMRGNGQSVGPEKLAFYRARVLEFARDHDEFSQVDFRSSPLSEGMGSSASSLVFDALRQEPDATLRVARQGPGTRKFYRLTRQAQAEIAESA
jgi:hypothetical protein